MIDKHCTLCNIAYCVPKSFDNDRRKDGAPFNCPNGHSLIYKKSALDFAKEKIARLESDMKFLKSDRDRYQNWYRSLEKSITALKGHLTRLRNKLNQ